MILERWSIAFVPSPSPLSYASSKGKGHSKDGKQESEGEEEAMQFYQACVGHFESLLSLLRSLPASAMVEELSAVLVDDGAKLYCKLSTTETSAEEGEIRIDRGFNDESVAVERVRLKEVASPFGYAKTLSRMLLSDVYAPRLLT